MEHSRFRDQGIDCHVRKTEFQIGARCPDFLEMMVSLDDEAMAAEIEGMVFEEGVGNSDPDAVAYADGIYRAGVDEIEGAVRFPLADEGGSPFAPVDSQS